jgi:uncharacterized membrane protein YdjX (TVP38/TMEM64 family)
MKKILLIFFILISSVLVSIFLINYQKIIYFLSNIDVSNPFNFMVYVFVIFVFFLTPFPTTIIVLLNGFIFKEYGFVISYIVIILTSAILFHFFYKIDKFIIFKKILKYFKNKTKIYNYSKNDYSIFLTRFIIPFFFHNISYGIIKVKFIKFILIISLAEIPVTFALNSIGSSLKDFSKETNMSIQSLVTDDNFYIPFLIVIVIFLFTNQIKKNI